MALVAEVVNFLALDAEALRHFIGGDALGHELVHIHHAGREGRGSAHIAAHRHPRHVLHTAGDDDLRLPRSDHRRAQMHRLLARATLEIHRRRRQLDWPFRLKHDIPRDVHALLIHLRHATHDDVVDILRCGATAGEQLVERPGAQRDRVDFSKPAVAPPNGCANRLHDDYFAHGFPSRSSYPIAAPV